MFSKITKLTNRKFYNKWLYKVTLRCEGCDVMRFVPLTEIIKFCQDGFYDSAHYFPSWRRAHNNKENLNRICQFLVNYSEDAYNLRIERSSVDVYTNDKNMYDKLSFECLGLVIHRFQPNAENIDILSNDNNCITVKKLPKKRYNYRVYLLPHKMAKDIDGKELLLDWMKKQSPKITCSPSIQRWFLDTDWNWDRRYVLVEDESTLLMFKLRAADVIGRIYKFVVCDK
jgi:hypothetical protein